MDQDWKSKSKAQDAVVQDRCPDTALANDGLAMDDLIVIRLEVVAAAAARVCGVERKATEAVVVESRPVQDMKEAAMEEIRALPEGQRQEYTTEETVMEEGQVLREGQR